MLYVRRAVYADEGSIVFVLYTNFFSESPSNLLPMIRSAALPCCNRQPAALLQRTAVRRGELRPTTEKSRACRLYSSVVVKGSHPN